MSILWIVLYALSVVGLLFVVWMHYNAGPAPASNTVVVIIMAFWMVFTAAVLVAHGLWTLFTWAVS